MKMQTLLALVMLSLAACNSQITGKAVQEDNIKVSFIGALSGDSAIIGEENLNGIRLAAEKLNSEGTEIRLVVKDDQMNERETLTQYRQLVNTENVNYILTSTYGGYIALAERAGDDNAIIINSLDSSEELSGLGRNAFAIGIYDESIAFAIADYLNEKGIEEAGLIVNLEDPFMLLMRDAFKEKYKGEFKEENYDFDSRDFKTVLAKLSYENIVLFGWEETGRIVKQAQELGLEKSFFGIDTMASEDFRENTGGNYEGLVFTFWQGSEENQVYTEMLDSYKARYGKEPENILFAAAGYDAMLVLGKALENCGDDVECVKSELSNVRDFQGATGKISIDPDHVTRSIKESMHMYRDGEIVSV